MDQEVWVLGKISKKVSVDKLLRDERRLEIDNSNSVDSTVLSRGLLKCTDVFKSLPGNQILRLLKTEGSDLVPQRSPSQATHSRSWALQ